MLSRTMNRPTLPRQALLSLKKIDMLKLLDCWGLTESVIKDVSKALVMPKITPLHAFFKTVQENALDIVDCSWDQIRAHYSSKFRVALPEDAPTAFRSVYIRDWAGRCWQLSQGQPDAAADDHVETPAKESRGVRDAGDTNLEILNKDASDSISADEKCLASMSAKKTNRSILPRLAVRR